MDRLGDLIASSLTVPDGDWLPSPPERPAMVAAAPVAAATDPPAGSPVGVILVLAVAGVLGAFVAVALKRA